jgi:hypothetical protein
VLMKKMFNLLIKMFKKYFQNIHINISLWIHEIRMAQSPWRQIWQFRSDDMVDIKFQNYKTKYISQKFLEKYQYWQSLENWAIKSWRSKSLHQLLLENVLLSSRVNGTIIQAK